LQHNKASNESESLRDPDIELGLGEASNFTENSSLPSNEDELTVSKSDGEEKLHSEKELACTICQEKFRDDSTLKSKLSFNVICVTH
jgi:pantoate kinase